MWMLTWIQKITLTNILKLILFLAFFYLLKWIILDLNSKSKSKSIVQGCDMVHNNMGPGAFVIS